MRRILIESNGNPLESLIYDEATGQLINDISEIHFKPFTCKNIWHGTIYRIINDHSIIAEDVEIITGRYYKEYLIHGAL